MGRKKARGLVKMNVRFPTMPQSIAKLGVDANGDVQRKLTDEVYANIKDFMPRKSGNLISQTSIKTPTRIRVEGPYARFLFFGKTRTGAPVNYSLEKNPKAGPNWDRRMVAERGDAIVARVQRYAKRKGRQ